MKRKFLYLISASLILLGGCAKVDVLEDPEMNTGSSGKFVLNGYADIQTRTSFDGVSENTIPFLWEAGDQIWMEQKKSQPILKAGPEAAFTFDFQPESTASLEVYYNMTGENDKALIPSIQHQTAAYEIQLGANGDFGHANVESMGNSFTLQHYTSYIWFDLSSPDITSKLSSITISSSEGSTLAGEAQFSEGKLGECSGSSSITLEFGKEGIELPKEAASEKVLAALVTYPADLSNELLSIRYTFADGSVYMSSRPGKLLEAGKTQKINTSIKAADCVKDGLFYLTENGWSSQLPETISNLKVLTIGSSTLTAEILTDIKGRLQEGASLDLSEAVYSGTEFNVAFDYNENLKSISLPANILGFPAKDYKGFEYARNLETVVLPESLTMISDRLFSNCKKLKNISLGENITHIGKLAFWRCDALESITLPASLESMGEGVFQECDHLSSEITIPEKLTEVFPKTFYNCSSLKKVILNDHITKIGKQAFQGTALAEMTLPQTVTRIEDMAFSNCGSLEKVINNGNITFIGESAFYECKNLGSFQLNNYMEAIGERAFQYCTALAGNITVDAKEVGGYAFWGCENITKIAFGTNVTNIATRAFMNTKKVDTISIKALVPPTLGSQAFSSTGNEAQGAKVLSVPAESFDEYDREWKTLINENKFELQEIGESALSEGIYYKASRSDEWAAVLPETFTSLYVKGIGAAKVNEETLNSIAAKVNAQATPVELNFKSAEYGSEEFPVAFKNSQKIKSIVFFSNTLTIAASAFEGAGELSGIELPSGMTSVKASTFKNTAKLQNIQLNEIQTIEASAFQGSGIVLADLTQVKALAEDAFADCAQLSEVKFGTTLENIADRTFMNCKSLKNIELGQNINSIGNSAFEGCDLKGIQLPEAVISLGKFAFKGNVNAAEIVLGSQLKDLPEGIFAGNNTISKLSVPESVQSIGASAFADWSQLTEIKIPENGLKEIGSKAFANAPLLANIYSERAEAPAIADDALSGSGTSVSGNKTIFVRDVAAYSSWATAAAAASFSIQIFGDDYLSDGIYYKTDEAGKWSNELPADFSTLFVQTVGNNTVLDKAEMDKIAAAVAGLSHSASIDLNKAKYESETFPASFKGNANLAGVVFPSNVTKTAASAFSKSGLTSVKILKGIAYGNDAYNGCASLTTVTFEDGVTEVAGAMFRNCSGIKTISLVNSITIVKSNAFNGCKGLSEVHLGSGLKKVDTYGFATCSALKEVYFPDATESIGQNAFTDCSSLEKVSFGTGMKTIEAYSFLGWSGGCGKLGDITCRGTVPPALPEDYGTTAFIDGYGFGAVGQNAAECILHLPVSTNPEGGSGAYQDSPGWVKLTTLAKPFKFVYDVD